MTVKESITKLLSSLKTNLKKIPESLIRWVLFITASMAISLLLDKLVVGMVQQIDVGQLPGDLERSLQSLKEFGQVVAIGVTFLLVFCMDKPKRRLLPQLLVCVLLPSLLVWPMKLAVHRLRPHQAEEYSTTLGLGFFWGSEPARGEFELEVSGKNKIIARGELSGSDIESFPSAHTATAFGFAVGLSNMYPAGRLIFYGLAIGCGFHRVLFGAHWFSDVIAGVFIGILLGRAGWRWMQKLLAIIKKFLESRRTKTSQVDNS